VVTDVACNVESAPPLHGMFEAVEQIHTRLITVSLIVDEARTFWRVQNPEQSKAEQIEAAFTERWFGNKSLARVRRLVRALHERFAVIPSTLSTLRQWDPDEYQTRALVCHWHTQLTDPLYRRFTSDFFEQRRRYPEPTVDHDVTLRWVQSTCPGRWSEPTNGRVASGLLSTAHSAGLCAEGPAQRALLFPFVTDDALTYLLLLLREVRFDGTLLSNPYLSSVGLTEGFLELRLRKLSTLRFSRMGDLTDIQWAFPDLKSWGDHLAHAKESRE
jgi:hypothetical protein